MTARASGRDRYRSASYRHPRRRRGDMFMLGLDLFFFAAILLIFWKVSAAFINTNPEEGLGTRQTATLNTYAVSEQMLLYLDESAKFAAYEALAKTMDLGGSIDTMAAPSPCGTYAGYEVWSYGGTPCFPDDVTRNSATAAGKNGAKASAASASAASASSAATPPASNAATHGAGTITKAFEDELQANLMRSISFPGFPRLRYRFDIRNENGLVVRGIPDEQIILPIITAKGDAQQTVTPLILKDSIIKTRVTAFQAESALPVKIEPSPNREDRTAGIGYVIISSTGNDDLQSALASYRDGLSSVHYLIDEHGAIYQMVPESQAARHLQQCDACAIDGKTLSSAAIEQQSIGIALLNPGMAPDKEMLTDSAAGKGCKEQRYLLLQRTNWCAGCKAGTTTDSAANPAPDPATHCWASYTPEQLETLKALLADIASRRGIGVQDIKLQDQINSLADSPGPALGASKDAGGQSAWLAQLLTDVAKDAARKSADRSATAGTNPGASAGTSALAGAGAGASASGADQGAAGSADGSAAIPAAEVGAVQMPLAERVITSCYGERVLASDGARGKTVNNHAGIDLGAKIGTNVYPITDGTVIQVTRSFTGECDCSTRGAPSCPAKCRRSDLYPTWGNMVLIKHNNGLYSRYSHLHDVLVSEGDAVSMKTVIATTGNTGDSEAPHLDLKIYTSDPMAQNAKTVNPLCIFAESELASASFGPNARSCTERRYQQLSHNDPVLAEECRNTPAFSSVPDCAINTQPVDPKGDDDLTRTLELINKQPGLMDEIKKAAQNGKLDYRLLIAIITVESHGQADIMNQYGFVGIGQLGKDACAEEKEFLKSCNLQCKCASGVCHASSVVECKGDSRTDPVASVHAMARHLRVKMDTPGIKGTPDGLRLGVSAYNAGQGTVLKAMAKTNSQAPRWEEVMPLMPDNEKKEYVGKVMQHYFALGGSISLAFADTTCGDMAVKEIGTYTFKPSFTVELPDLFTALNRTSSFARSAYDTCTGAAAPANALAGASASSTAASASALANQFEDNRVCLQQKTAAFLKGSSDLAAVACDGANESLVESLREAIRDCRDNLQQDCTCYWQAPAGFAGKNLTIDIYGGTEFQIVVDGVPLAVQSPASNTPASDAGGEYRDNVDAEPWRAERIRYAFLYNGALAGKYVEAGKLHHDLATDEYLPFYKDGDAINWIADPSGTQACGLFKTMQRVCIGIKRPIYLLSKGETINPVIRFAIDLEDAKNPDAISGLAIDSPRVPRLTGVAQLDNANVIASNAVAVSEQRFASPTIQAPERGDPYVTMASAATRLTASFTASQSPDVSYYMVRCTTADKEFPEEFTFSYARRNASIGSQYGGAITVELDDCGGTIKPGQCVLPGVPPATTPPQINKPGCYKISITPVDLSGNEGDTIIYDQSKAVLPDDNPLSVQKAEAPAVHKAASTSALPQHMIAPLPAVSPASTTSTAQQNPATPTSTAPSTPSSQATQQQVQQTTNSTAALPPWILPWSGKDPYPAIDWSAADPELKQDVDAFDEAWQKKGYSALQVRQVYRPEEYQSHLRTIWETYRILHGLSYTEGYGCDGWPHLDPAQVKSYNLSAEQMTLLNAEYKRHDVAIDPTPPACKSDHSLGIAIDITPPARSGPVFNAWVVAGSSVGLCHYIAGDMPHFALKDELPAGTACNVG